LAAKIPVDPSGRDRSGTPQLRSLVYGARSIADSPVALRFAWSAAKNISQIPGNPTENRRPCILEVFIITFGVVKDIIPTW